MKTLILTTFLLFSIFQLSNSATCTQSDNFVSYQVCKQAQEQCELSLKACQDAIPDSLIGGTVSDLLALVGVDDPGKICVDGVISVFNSAMSSVSGCECDLTCDFDGSSSAPVVVNSLVILGLLQFLF